MTSRYEVWVNDAALSDIDPRIYVADIGYQPASVTRSSGRLAGGQGELASGWDYYGTSKTTVSCVIRAYSTAERQRVIQSIVRWAQAGGWLKTSDRPDQRIWVKPTRLPAAGSVMRWLDAVTVEFTAYEWPFWTDIAAQTVTVSSGSVLRFNSALPGFAEFDITLGGGDARVKTMAVTVGDRTITLDNVNVKGGHIILTYTEEHHILRIYHQPAGQTTQNSILQRRTADSADDLILKPGSNALAFSFALNSEDSGSNTATCVVSGKGVYL